MKIRTTRLCFVPINHLLLNCTWESRSQPDLFFVKQTPQCGLLIQILQRPR